MIPVKIIWLLVKAVIKAKYHTFVVAASHSPPLKDMPKVNKKADCINITVRFKRFIVKAY